MPNFSESVLCRQLADPGLHIRCLELYCESAVAADQVMVVLLACAESEDGLPIIGTQNIQQTLFLMGLQHTVNRSQGDFFSTVAEDAVKILGGDKVFQLAQDGPHRTLLAGGSALHLSS